MSSKSFKVSYHAAKTLVIITCPSNVYFTSFFSRPALDSVLFEEVMEGAGEEGAILNDGTTTEGEDWNGYTSGDFY